MIRNTTAVGPEDTIRIVFMTDGQANSGNSERGLQKFTTWAKTLTCKKIHVDAIAFTTTENVEFLNRIRTPEGMFRFCKDHETLSTMFGEFFDVIGCTDTKQPVDLVLPPNSVIIGSVNTDGCPSEWPSNNGVITIELLIGKVTAQRIAISDQILEGSISSEQHHNKMYTHVTVNGTQHKVPIQVVTEGKDFYDVMLANVDRRGFELCGDSKPNNADGFQAELAPLQEQLVRCRALFNDKTLSKVDRARLRVRFVEVQGRVNQVLHYITTYSRYNTPTNQLIAEMNSLKFDGVMASARRQRQADNIAMRNNNDTVIDALNHLTYNESDLPSGPDADEFYRCFIGLESLSDIMAESPDGMLGFGVNVKRLEEVVDEPTLMGVKGISTSIVSRTAMLDAIKYQQYTDGVNLNVCGFDTLNGDTTVAMVGRSREPINAWLPLYICEAHWQRVRCLIKPTLGFLCVMDPLGYSKKQLWVMLLVLGTMCQQGNTDSFGERELTLLLAFTDTCRAMLRDNAEFAEIVTSTLGGFVRDPVLRLKDKVPNLTVLVGAMLVVPPEVAKQHGDDHFWLVLQIECLRRQCGYVYKHSGPFDASNDSTAIAGFEGNELLAGDRDVAVLTLEAIVGDNPDVVPMVAVLSPMSEVEEVEEEMEEVSQRRLIMLCERWAGILLGVTEDDEMPEDPVDFAANTQCKVLAWWDIYQREISNTMTTTAKETDQSLATTPNAINACALLLNRLVTPQYGQFDVASSVVAVVHDNYSTPVFAVASLLAKMRRDCHSPVQSFFTSLKYGLGNDGLVGDGLAVLQGVLIQCIAGSSNKAARDMAHDWVEPTDPDFMTKVCMPMQRGRDETKAAMLRTKIRQCIYNNVSRQMATEGIMTFIGLLNTVYTTRNAEYNQLLARLCEDDVTSSLMKITVLITGQFKGVNIFDRGNPKLPTGHAAKMVIDACGQDWFDSIARVVNHNTCVRHVYRACDTPNRHNHCNSNPYRICECVKCLAL
jgi:hypothetical protein